MIDEMGCKQVEELAPELALDVVGGQERDAALRHVAGCASCRRLVSDLTSVGEDLLLLAPPRDPPAGFEERVLARVVAPPARERTPRRWLRAAAAMAAVFLAAAIAAGSMYVATADDRRLAGTYRGLLGEAGGSYFAVATLDDDAGRVGTVFGYQGNPSWIFVSVPSDAAQRFTVRLVTRDGDVIELGDATLGGADSGWGRAIPVLLSDVSAVRLSGPDGDLVASFGDANPWD